ncbi:SseB family protein [Brevundimonas subvibrioides]|uniref:SseB family protein n=1 Tax=Brevundimonas subvibrioides TaxID=74313 RepID=UPI0022B4247B|nr:SseB family protein [Brevundimonas subvibrioides]
MVAPFVPAPPADLVDQALSAAIADPGLTGAFELALASAVVYVVPADGVPPPGQVFGLDVPFQLMGITLKDGTPANALFTTRAAAARNAGEAAVMGIRGLHALEILRDGWIVLNPGAETGLVLSPEQIRTILKGLGDVRLTDAGQAARAVTVPEREPTELVDRLRRVLTHAHVTGAWLGRTTNASTGAQGWYLQVRGSAPFANVRLAVEQAAGGLDFHGETLDLTVMTPDAADGTGLRIV